MCLLKPDKEQYKTSGDSLILLKSIRQRWQTISIKLLYNSLKIYHYSQVRESFVFKKIGVNNFSLQ